MYTSQLLISSNDKVNLSGKRKNHIYVEMMSWNAVVIYLFTNMFLNELLLYIS